MLHFQRPKECAEEGNPSGLFLWSPVYVGLFRWPRGLSPAADWISEYDRGEVSLCILFTKLAVCQEYRRYRSSHLLTRLTCVSSTPGHHKQVSCLLEAHFHSLLQYPPVEWCGSAATGRHLETTLEQGQGAPFPKNLYNLHILQQAAQTQGMYENIYSHLTSTKVYIEQ